MSRSGAMTMFDIIVLLAGLMEDAALSTLLRQHNPDLTIRSANSRADIDRLTGAELRSARLIGFLTPVIVPERVLHALGFGAYNFHPGPPQYPGWMPSRFAFYDGVTRFGVTAHKMAARVDAGSIVGVRGFDVDPNGGVSDLEQQAFTESARLFWELAKALATQSEPLAELPIEWGERRSTQRMHAAMCDIPPGITKDDLARRIAAFGAGDMGVHITINLYGHRFRYVDDAKTGNIAAPGLVPAQIS